MLVIAAPGTVMAQAALAPPNPQQQRCIESFAPTQQEKKFLESLKELFECSERGEQEAKCVIAVFGSEEAARAAHEKVTIETSTRRLELLRKSAKEGHLPSMYLLAGWTTESEDLRGISGLPTAEESSAAYRALHDQRFPLVPRILARECLEEVPDTPESFGRAIEAEAKIARPERTNGQVPRIQKSGTEIEILDSPEALEAYDRAREAREAEEARRRAEIPGNREVCLGLLREGGFRGDMSAWERLASYDNSNPPPREVGIVPPVEHYAWLELEKMEWREKNWEDESNVPLMHQEELAKGYLNDEQRKEALALAEQYVRILWPRRIRAGDAEVCRVIPQFAGDPEPYGSDPSPR